ncbi:MAG: helix-turn-helix domain-containing protein, partial [Candidatus Acetothermia bacterium]|nr:helix-turn-helix domain-containing protein [Candidatus Acetothermia bacterium]
MSAAPRVELSEKEREALTSTVRAKTSSQRDVFRARIVVLAAQGKTNVEIAQALGASRPTVGLWRSRFARLGLEGLKDRPRPGRPRVYAEAASTTRRRSASAY